MTTLLRKFTIMIMLAVAALSVSAQTGVGNWVIHPVFAENIINIVDTGDLIYYLADGNLFYFYYVKENNKHMIVIEPSEELVQMMIPYFQAGVYQG